MAKVITKDDVTAAVEKAVEKAVAAETKRCIKAVKTSAADAIADFESDDKQFNKGAKAAQAAAVANINADAE